jgi:hypothetical protein
MNVEAKMVKQQAKSLGIKINDPLAYSGIISKTVNVTDRVSLYILTI